MTNQGTLTHTHKRARGKRTRWNQRTLTIKKRQQLLKVALTRVELNFADKKPIVGILQLEFNESAQAVAHR